MGERGSVLDLIFAALAHPARRKILKLLEEDPIRVTDLAASFDCSLNVVSKHVLSLEKAGLVQRERHGREHRLRLNTGPLAEAFAFIDRYRIRWEGKLDRLAAHLDQMAEAETKVAAAIGKPRNRKAPK
jgi:DNA-binding transcriptional ArsR family regulator